MIITIRYFLKGVKKRYNNKRNSLSIQFVVTKKQLTFLLKYSKHSGEQRGDDKGEE